MKVLIVIGSFPPDHSGAGLRIQKTYAYLEEHYGANWNVLTCARHDNAVDDAHVSYFDVSSISSVMRFCQRIIFSDYDILHIIGNAKITRLACVIARLCGKKYIVELSIDPDENSYGEGWKKALFDKAFFAADGFIALTPRIKSYFEQGADNARIFLRPNPVTIDSRMSKEVDPDIGTYRKTHEFAHLLFGRFTKRKGQMLALEMIENVKNHELVLAGPVLNKEDEDYVTSLKEYIRQHNLSERVTLIPRFIGNIMPLYEKVDSLWCLSEREGLPNVVLEALWGGLPVFVKSSLGLEHIVVNGENGLNMDKLNIHEIESYLKDGFDCDRIQNMARKEFSLENHCARTWGFLNDAI